MKLVIDTQYCENYGAHTWDGKGECPQRWKFKGGSTYVVDNVTPAQKERIEREGIPNITSLIEYSSEGSKEYILGYRVVEDTAPEGEPWDTPFRLVYTEGKWVARREIDNAGEYGGAMRSEIKTKFESYVMLPQGERTSYIAEYELKDGQFAKSEEELRKVLL
jgi:hypothetical protein